MKAAFVQNGAIQVGEVEEPIPSAGQALVRTHSCGLCASDAHFLHSGQHVIDLSRKFGGAYAGLDTARAFVPGHEYVGEVIDHGPGSKRTVKSGESVSLSGKAPLSVVVGKAVGVDVLVRGQPLDLVPLTKGGGIARFEVK